MKKIKSFMTMVLVVAMVISSFGVTGNRSVKAATNGVVKASDVVDEIDSFTTTLSSGESVTISIKNHILSINVDSKSYTFKIANISSTTKQAVVNEKDGLLHILARSRAYYCFDLYTGVQMIIYSCNVNDKYCSKENMFAYQVYGNSLIDNMSFYQGHGSTSEEEKALITRYEFDRIVDGGDPAMEDLDSTPTPIPTANSTSEPTPTATANSTPKPTATVSPIAEPTATVAPTTAAPTSTPTVTVEPTVTVSPTVEPTATVTPTAVPTAIPTATVAPIPEPTPTVTPSSTKESYSVKQQGQKVQLMRGYNGKTEAISTIIFNKKKGTVKFNNHTYKKVKDCGYSQKSHQVVLLMKNGSIKILPTGKGKNVKKYTVRTYKGSYISLQNSIEKLIIKAKTKDGKSLNLKKAKPFSK